MRKGEGTHRVPRPLPDDRRRRRREGDKRAEEATETLRPLPLFASEGDEIFFSFWREEEEKLLQEDRRAHPRRSTQI